ncbi:MAG: hypothetical protein Q8O67_00285 [Deltaproteobacteria bacterium]|nr:hypothetical protein [Deltaproteobacteria bacterium]
MSITVSTATRPGISDDARRRLQVVSKSYMANDRGSAVVLTQSGFANSIVRAIIGSVTLLAGANIRIFGDVDGALFWMTAVIARERLDDFDAAAVRETLQLLS